MDILDLLAAEHRDVQGLFGEYSRLAEKAIHSRQTVSSRIFAALEAHTRLEEELFYPELETSTLTADAIRAARVAHAEIGLLVRSLRESLPGDPAFETRIAALKEFAEEHFAEEEEEIFPAALQILGPHKVEELATRAQAFRAEQDEMELEEPPIPPVPSL